MRQHPGKEPTARKKALTRPVASRAAHAAVETGAGQPAQPAEPKPRGIRAALRRVSRPRHKQSTRDRTPLETHRLGRPGKTLPPHPNGPEAGLNTPRRTPPRKRTETTSGSTPAKGWYPRLISGPETPVLARKSPRIGPFFRLFTGCGRRTQTAREIQTSGREFRGQLYLKKGSVFVVSPFRSSHIARQRRANCVQTMSKRAQTPFDTAVIRFLSVKLFIQAENRDFSFGEKSFIRY